jgi:prophage antirepressor-like protein
VFNFESHNVRTVVDDNGAIWFVAKDVAIALGYVRPNDAINEHCKGAAIHRPLQTAGGMQQARVLGEPNLYRLIFGSTLESAKRFQDWVFEEVLPTIRKTGKYEIQKPNQKLKAAHLKNSKKRRSLLA